MLGPGTEAMYGTTSRHARYISIQQKRAKEPSGRKQGFSSEERRFCLWGPVAAANRYVMWLQRRLGIAKSPSWPGQRRSPGAEARGARALGRRADGSAPFLRGILQYRPRALGWRRGFPLVGPRPTPAPCALGIPFRRALARERANSPPLEETRVPPVLGRTVAGRGFTPVSCFVTPASGEESSISRGIAPWEWSIPLRDTAGRWATTLGRRFLQACLSLGKTAWAAGLVGISALRSGRLAHDPVGSGSGAASSAALVSLGRAALPSHGGRGSARARCCRAIAAVASHREALEGVAAGSRISRSAYPRLASAVECSRPPGLARPSGPRVRTRSQRPEMCWLTPVDSTSISPGNSGGGATVRTTTQRWSSGMLEGGDALEVRVARGPLSGDIRGCPCGRAGSAGRAAWRQVSGTAWETSTQPSGYEVRRSSSSRETHRFGEAPAVRRSCDDSLERLLQLVVRRAAQFALPGPPFARFVAREQSCSGCHRYRCGSWVLAR